MEDRGPPENLFEHDEEISCRTLFDDRDLRLRGQCGAAGHTGHDYGE
jgi:hypothetical protein